MSETKFNLYKKYRPKTFKDVIGQDNIRNLLSQTLNKSVKLQSFIFYGPSGTGKTSLARIFAKACNCKFFTEIGDVCNKCENCLSIDNEETQDIWEIDAASFNGVEHMRGLIESTRYLPHFLKTKVYIVDEAHNLSGPAWNTLLKPTEEPISENIVFLFLTTNIHKIPETILNRCQKHGFSKLDNSEIEQLIDKVSKSEEKIIDNDAKQSLVSLSQGSARECLSLLNQLFLSTGNFVQISDVEKVFSLSNKQEMLDMIIHLKNKDLQNSLSLLEKFEKNNNHILNFFSSIFSAYIDLYLYRKTKNISLMKKLSEEEAKKLVDEKSDYLSYAKILERGIQSFNNFSNSLEREKIILFELWEVPEIINSTNKNTFKEINQNPKKEEIIEEKKLINFETKIKIPEIKDIQTKIELETPKESKQDWNFQVTLEKKETNEPQIISEEMEKNLIYGLNKKYIDQEKSEEIYEKYKRILDGEKPEYKEISYIFSKVTPPKIGKSKINGKKELLTTDKTVILPFSKKEHAEEFNELFKQPEIKEQLQECFIYDLEWIGVTNSLIKDSLKKIINKSEKTNTTPKIFEFKDDEFNEIIEILKD